MADQDKLESIGHEDWIRLAAFIDGEGTIVISNGSAIYNKNGRVYLTLRVQISNTDIRLMQWLKSTFGGSISSIRPSTDRAKPAFIWTVGSMAAEAVVRGCRPFLLLKREQADIAISFRETFHRGRNQVNHLTEPEWEMREKLRLDLKELNFRGVRQ